MNLIRKAVTAWRLSRHVKETVRAIEFAEAHEAEPIARDAMVVASTHTEAAERCREALRSSARTHIGRMAQR